MQDMSREGGADLGCQLVLQRRTSSIVQPDV